MHKLPARRAAVQLRYELQPQGAALMGWVSASGADSEFVLPVIIADDENYDMPDSNTVILHRDGGDIRVSHSGLAADPKRIFNFSGGFSALELKMKPDKDGNFGAVISCIALVNKNWTLGHEKLDTKAECLKTPSLTEP